MGAEKEKSTIYDIYLLVATGFLTKCYAYTLNVWTEKELSLTRTQEGVKATDQNGCWGSSHGFSTLLSTALTVTSRPPRRVTGRIPEGNAPSEPVCRRSSRPPLVLPRTFRRERKPSGGGGGGTIVCACVTEDCLETISSIHQLAYPPYNETSVHVLRFVLYLANVNFLNAIFVSSFQIAMVLWGERG